MRLTPLCAAAFFAGTPLTAEAEPEVVVSAGGGRGGPSESVPCLLNVDCQDIVTDRSGLLGFGVAESIGHFRASLRFDSTLGTGDTVGVTSSIVTSVGLYAGPVYAELGLGLGINYMSDTVARDSLLVSPSVHTALGVRVTDSFAVVARLDGLAGAPLSLLLPRLDGMASKVGFTQCAECYCRDLNLTTLIHCGYEVGHCWGRRRCSCRLGHWLLGGRFKGP